ncbi:MAG: acyl-CoA dehydrogenase family protein [Ilumatobacteraceae bacterium]
MNQTTVLDPHLDHDAAHLPEELLARFRGRAAAHDASGVYPHHDLDELRNNGWLLAPAPIDVGGLGLDLAQVAAGQRQLGRFAPATALSTSMHLYWVGLGADLTRFGHPFGPRILDWATSGEVLASGHGEAGNDIPIALSTTRAERVPGGWRIHGRKLFGSLGPVWDRLGFHAMDATDPAGPVVVHGFLAREAAGVDVIATWDAQGMRATESHDTLLDGAFVSDADVLAVVPAGPSDDPAVGTMAIWALTLISNVYVGIAERAMEIAIEHCHRATSIAIPAGTLDHHPLVQARIAEMHLELAAARAQLDRLAADWVGSADHGSAWPVHVFTAKWRSATAAMRVVDLACDVVGGASFRRGHELERLSRDVRAARFHPGTDAFTHEAIGKALLGISPAGPRW